MRSRNADRCLRRAGFLALMILGLALAAPARATGMNQRVLIVTSRGGEPFDTVETSIRRKLALIPGVEVTSVDGAEGVGGAELGGSPPAAIVALGSVAAAAVAADAFAGPVVRGLVLSAEDPPSTAQVTAVTLAYPIEVQLEWIKRVLPRARTLGVISSEPAGSASLALLRAQVSAAGLGVEIRLVKDPKDLPRALDSLADVVDVLWGLPDPMVYTQRTAQNILLFCFRSRVPMIGLSESWVKAGALFALGWDYADIGAQCAEQVSRILKGAAPSSVATVGPRTALVVLNVRTARHMRVDIPEAIVAAAQTVE